MRRNRDMDRRRDMRRNRDMDLHRATTDKPLQATGRCLQVISRIMVTARITAPRQVRRHLNFNDTTRA